MSSSKAEPGEFDSTTDLRELRFQRTLEEEVSGALSALDCILLGRKGVYASSELTSGRRAHRLQRDHGLPNLSTLRDHLGQERYETLLWNPNVAAAAAFADELRKRLGDVELLISPAPFTASGWTQAAYLAFWEKVIRTRVKAVYFNDDWEYSNGCVYEFAVANDAQLPTFDRKGVHLSLQQGIDRIAVAIRVMEGDGLNAEAINATLASMMTRGAR
jgi:hypothetical protein